MDAFSGVRQKFSDAGIDVTFLCYNVSADATDDEIEYAFLMAEALGVKAITTSTQVSMAKRIAPFADKHHMRVGFHNHHHSSVSDPEDIVTPDPSRRSSLSRGRLNQLKWRAIRHT